ncbi:MAG: dual specificity protein phosphatase family protein [Candidatus Methanofastidiosa archaeon]|nr:dual specificity protein phosphatase family protein [Candidatus Methanofastidiosa archaeon]
MRNLFLGDDEDCFYEPRKGWKVVHACREPCFAHAEAIFGCAEGHGTIEAGGHLYLDLLDTVETYDDRHARPLLSRALDFIEGNVLENKVLVHCNVCVSRSPSIVLLYLAKRAGRVSNASFEAAAREFSDIYYPYYFPSRGIETYLRRFWKSIS